MNSVRSKELMRSTGMAGSRFLQRGVVALLFLVGTQASWSETATDLQRVEQRVQDYYYGFIERDEARLVQAFDIANGTVKLPYSNESGAGFENGLFANIVPSWASKKPLSQLEQDQCELEILGIDIVRGSLASVRIRMKVVDEEFIDLLSLQKIKGRWKITNKSFVPI